MVAPRDASKINFGDDGFVVGGFKPLSGGEVGDRENGAGELFKVLEVDVPESHRVASRECGRQSPR